MARFAAAAEFITSHARLLDRRRHAALEARDPLARERAGAGVIRALEAYRNDDGGYGWGIEPDLRSPESQVAGALHALEALVDAAPARSVELPALLEWLQQNTLPDGGLPFALPVQDPVACAPFWASADPRQSSLQLTAAVAAQAHLLADQDPRVAAHPWLETATDYCLREIRALGPEPFAYVLSFAVQFLDACSAVRPEAAELLESLRRFIPEDGRIAVAGGAEGECLRLLDYAPRPGGSAQALFGSEAVSRDLDRLEREQQEDGGWQVGFASYSAAATVEWQGYTAVRSVAVLRANGR